jgi:hypothetical protein
LADTLYAAEPYYAPEPYGPPAAPRRDGAAGLVVGVTLVVAAGGTLLYAYKRGLLGAVGSVAAGSVQVTLSPQPINSQTAQTIAAVVSFRNGSSTPGTFGVQGVVIEAGAPGQPVGGHFFVSPSAAQQAQAAYQQAGGGQAGVSAAAAFSAKASNRVAILSNVSGEGQAKVYTEFTAGAVPYTLAALIYVAPNPPSGQLIVSDPVGVDAVDLRGLPGSVTQSVPLGVS